MIPKVIHFTWMTERLPPRFQRILDAWRESHADWEVKLWTDVSMREMVAENYQDFLALYDGYAHNIQRADAFRYFVLHTFGGIYADVDVEPLRRIDQLTEKSACFVGLEPVDHVGRSFAIYTGLPYLLCNAFMGSEPGHPYWPHVFTHLRRCVSDGAMISTGPFFLTGAGLIAPRAHRPDLIAPEDWSPLIDTGQKATPSPAMLDRARQRFDVLDIEGGPLVSHLWAGTWHRRREEVWFRWAWQWPNNLKWWIRRKLRPDLLAAGELFTRPARTYDDQDMIVPDPLPTIYIAVPLKNAEPFMPWVKANIERFDYPRELITVGFLVSDSDDNTFGAAQDLKAAWNGQFAGIEIDELNFGYSLLRRRRGRAKHQKRRRSILGVCRTRMAKRAAEVADYCLFMDSDLCVVPADSIKRLLSARRPVVMANCLLGESKTFDQNAFVLHSRPDFKYLYRAVSRDGTVYPSRRSDNRLYVDDLKFLRIAPLDSVGGTLLLIDNDVIRAGVEFTSEPYKYHLETESFAMMARDLGFEVCCLPDLVVWHETDGGISRPAKHALENIGLEPEMLGERGGDVQQD